MCISVSLSGFVVLGCMFAPKVHIIMFQPQKNVTSHRLNLNRFSVSGAAAASYASHGMVSNSRPVGIRGPATSFFCGPWKQMKYLYSIFLALKIKSLSLEPIQEEMTHCWPNILLYFFVFDHLYFVLTAIICAAPLIVTSRKWCYLPSNWLCSYPLCKKLTKQRRII